MHTCVKRNRPQLLTRDSNPFRGAENKDAHGLAGASVTARDCSPGTELPGLIPLQFTHEDGAGKCGSATLIRLKVRKVTISEKILFIGRGASMWQVLIWPGALMLQL